MLRYPLRVTGKYLGSRWGKRRGGVSDTLSGASGKNSRKFSL